MESAEYEIRLRDVFSAGLGKLEGRMNQFESKIGGLGSSIASVFGGITLASAVSSGLSMIGDLAKSVVSLGADMEMTRVSFATMLGGDETRADKLINDIVDLGAKTVFTSSQINKQAQLLLNYGTAVDDVIPTLTMLGDASAGNVDSFAGLTRAFGQIQATGRLMGQDLNQLINAGFNPLQEISKKTGKSMAVLKKEVEDGAISFDMVKEAFKSATSEGGRFFGLNDKLSKTLSGRWSTLQDTIERMGTALGTKLLPFLGKVVDGLAAFAEMIPKLDFSAITTAFGDLFDVFRDVFNIFAEMFGMLGINISLFDVLQFAINQVGIAFRIVATTVGAVYTGYKILVGLVKDSILVWQGLGDIISGVFSLDQTKIFGGINKIKVGIAEMADNAKGTAMAFFKNESDAYGRIGNPLASKDKSSDGSTAGAAAGKSGTASATAGKAIGVEKIQAGTRNVVVNITKLIEKVNFEKGYKESETKLQEMITKALLTAVNDVNIVSQ